MARRPLATVLPMPPIEFISRLWDQRDIGEVPTLRLAGGMPLPIGWRALRWLLVASPPIVQRLFGRILGSDTWRPRLLRRVPECVATYPNGLKFHIRHGDSEYTRLFLGGEHEPAVTRIVRGLLRPGDFAIDVGANHGWHTLTMAEVVGAHGLVWALEPTPPTFDGLRANLALNPQLNVRPFQLAAGAESGVAHIHLFEGLPHGHASASPLGRNDFTTFEIDVASLDDLVDQNPPNRSATLIKVDVEGSELRTLQGASRLLQAETAPIWLLEVNHETAGAFGYRPHECLDALRTTGSYVVFRISGSGLIPEHTPEDAPDGTMWVCVPEDRVSQAEPLLSR